MHKPLLFAVAAAFVALVGCSADTSDKTDSSDESITGTESPKQDVSTNKPAPKDAPLPPLDGPGADGTVTQKKLIQLPATFHINPEDVPKPPVEDTK